MSRSLRLRALFLLALGCAAIGCSGEVEIGAIVSETDAAGPYGRSVKKGLDLALEKINADGGRFILIYRDDQSNPETGKEVAQFVDHEEERPQFEGMLRAINRAGMEV